MSEINQSIDLGNLISISPNYTFYYSRKKGGRCIKNNQLIRVYSEYVAGRYGSSYIIFEWKGNGKEKIPGNVNYLNMRMAYDSFCPQVLIGEKGREMDKEQLMSVYDVRKQALKRVIFTSLCWGFVSFLCAKCKYLDAASRLFLIGASTIFALIILIRCLCLLIKDR